MRQRKYSCKQVSEYQGDHFKENYRFINWSFVVDDWRFNLHIFLRILFPSKFTHLQLVSHSDLHGNFWEIYVKWLHSSVTDKCTTSQILVGWLVGWFGLWHINLCKLFNAKSIFIEIISCFKQFSLAKARSSNVNTQFKCHNISISSYLV